MGMEKLQRLLLIPVVLMAATARGQVDPQLRELLQFGFNQPVQGASPVAAYGYYYLNEPDFFHTNVTLRLALAPVYLDSEVGLVGLLGPHTDLGLGLAGGAFADNYYEFQKGKYLPEQSFGADSVAESLSLYHLFDPDKRIPLFGLLRVTEHYDVYQGNDQLSPGFVLPRNHSTFDWRAGLRLGGREPLLQPRSGPGAFRLGRGTVSQRRRPLRIGWRPGAGGQLGPVLGARAADLHAAEIKAEH